MLKNEMRLNNQSSTRKLLNIQKLEFDTDSNGIPIKVTRDAVQKKEQQDISSKNENSGGNFSIRRYIPCFDIKESSARCYVNVIAEVEGVSVILTPKERDAPRPFNIILERVHFGVPNTALTMVMACFTLLVIVILIVLRCSTPPSLWIQQYSLFEKNSGGNEMMGIKCNNRVECRDEHGRSNSLKTN